MPCTFARRWACRGADASSGLTGGPTSRLASCPVEQAVNVYHAPPPRAIDAGTPLARAALDELEREVGSLGARRLDRLVLLRIERRQHVIRDLRSLLAGCAGTANADLDPAEIPRAEGVNQGEDAVVPARAARHPNADLAEREIEVVEDDDEIGGAEVELPAEPRRRGSRDVHVGPELDQVERIAAPAR